MMANQLHYISELCAASLGGFWMGGKGISGTANSV